MPIVVDPTFVPPAPPASVTSADGILTATVDQPHAGVLLKADFSALTPAPIAVRFLRGDAPVRSGDTAPAPGGIAVAYDHESPLGQPSSWTAVPVFADGTEGPPSQPVAVTVPEIADPQRCVWLKSPTDPDVSRQVWLETPPDLTREASTSLTGAVGSRFPVGSWDVRGGYATSFAVVTESPRERADLEALLDTGPLLYQCSQTVDLPDFWFLPGDVSWTWVGPVGQEVRQWTIGVTEIARPSTVGASLRIPGNSCADLLDAYPTCADLLAAVPTCLDLLGA